MTERDIEDYFATIGVGHPKSEAVFIRKGRKRFGDTFDKVMSVIVQRGAGNKVNPYDLKNASLDLSLYVGEHYASETWRALAQWFVREQLPAPERVLDLGCENGVVSCLLATLWPQSQILGLDRSGHAISAARELAARLGRKNVTFEPIKRRAAIPSAKPEHVLHDRGFSGNGRATGKSQRTKAIPLE